MSHTTLPGWRAVALVAVVFTILSLLATWPLALNLNDSFLGSFKANDMRFNLWVIFWGYHSLFSDPLNLHHANIYYPELYTFAYSDIELSHSLLMAPLIAINYNPAFIYNTLVLLSLIIGGVGWYLLLYRFTNIHTAAIGGAIIIQFCAGRFGRYSQIQFFGDHWLPWALLALWLWLAASDGRRRWLWAALAAALFSLHALSGSHSAVFGIIIVGAAGLFLAIRQNHLRSGEFYAQLAMVIAIILLVLVPVFYPYFIVGEAMAEHRVAGEYQLQEGSAGAVEWFRSGSRFYRWLEGQTGWPGSILQDQAKGSLWPGLVPWLLLGIALLYSGKAGPERKAQWLPLTLDALTTLALIILLIAILLPYGSLHNPGDIIVSPPFWIALLGIAAGAARLAMKSREPHLLHSIYSWAGRHLMLSANTWLWLGLLLFSMWASLGPDGLLYKLLADLPAVSLIRVPRRFFLIGIIALGVFAAFAFAQMKRHMNARNFLVTYAVLLGLFAVESNYAPLRLYPVGEVPALYQWYGEHEEEFTVFEYPVDETGYAAFIRQVYGSIHHWKRLIVGYSGFQSEANKALLRELNQNFPNEWGLTRLAELDTRYVAVFTDRIDQTKQAEILEAVSAGRLQEAKSYGSLVVYQLSSWSAQP